MTVEASRLRYLYWRFNVLGVATLVAWNIYIVSSDFFRHEFRDTPFKDNFESVFSVLSNAVNLAALCYALYTQQKADHDRRIKGGLLATVAVLGAISLISVCGVEGWAALAVSLLALCVAAVAAAYIQCSIFGIAALLPSCCAEGYMSGQAIAGTLASAAQLAAIYLDWGTSREGESLDVYGQQALAVDGYWRLRLRTAMYFLASAIFLVFSTLAWAQLNARLALPSAVARNRLEQDSYAPLATSDNVASHANETNQPSSVSALVAPMREDSPRLTRADRTEFPSTPESGPTNLHIRPVPPLLTELEDLGSEEATAPTPTSEANVESGEVSSSWLTQFGLSNAQQLYRTFAEVSPFVYICAIVMGQTLAVFPPLTEAIVSSPYSSPRISNLSAWHFFLFNASDYLGRLSTQWLSCSSPKILHGINGARTLLIPAFLMFPTLATSPQAAFVVHSDILFLLLVLVLGWSNGWVATTALIAGPRLASDKETAGSILGFALCVGLVIGAAASYPVLLIAGIS